MSISMDEAPLSLSAGCFSPTGSHAEEVDEKERLETSDQTQSPDLWSTPVVQSTRTSRHSSADNAGAHAYGAVKRSPSSSPSRSEQPATDSDCIEVTSHEFVSCGHGTTTHNSDSENFDGISHVANASQCEGSRLEHDPTTKFDPEPGPDNHTKL